MSKEMDIRWPVIGVVVVALFAAGCSTHKPVDAGEVDAALKDSFSRSGNLEAPDRWWEAFGNEQLTALIETGLGENLDIQQAWARLRQADATLKSAKASGYPQVNLSGSASRTRNAEGAEKTVDSLGATASASYEVDLWNVISASEKASWYTYQATRKDLESTALAMSAKIAEVWLSILEQQQTLALLKDQLAVNEDYLHLVELRFSRGQADAVDVLQQRQQVAATQASFPAVEAKLEVLQNSLAILLGKAPGTITFSAESEMPSVPELPDTGIPADVIAKRPDVAAGEYRLLSADQRLAVARGNLYPSFSISASGGAKSDSLSDLLDSWFVNLTGNILAPIFDGGSRRAEVQRTRAVVEEYLLSWKQSLLTAFQEVEDALVYEEGQRRTLVEIEKQITLAETTLERSRKNYVNGLSDYLNVLTSLQALQKLEQNEIQTRAQLLLYRVDLYIALGGDWTTGLQEPATLVTDMDKGE